jgi:AAA domain/Primase C terminal 2 (PriCT-2)
MSTNATTKNPLKPPWRDIDADSIPQELRDLTRWVGWCWEWNPKAKKWDKPPVSVETGIKISKTDPRSWATFDEAKAAFQSGRIDGIGFCIAKVNQDHPVDDPFVVVDVDNCIDAETGLPNEWAAYLLELLNGTYAEVSPSGHGIKIFVRAKLGPGRKEDEDKGIELLGPGSYVCVTGLICPGCADTVSECQELIDYLQQNVVQGQRGDGDKELRTDREVAVDAIRALAPWRSDDYKNWIRVGQVLHSVDSSLLGEWDSWSRGSEKYREGVCAAKWQTFSTAGNGLRIGTLVKWAKEDGWIPPRRQEHQNGHASADQKLDSHLDIVCLADVQAKQVPWLWPGRVPQAMLTLLAAQPDAGKTQVACDITSRITRGAAWPDGSGIAPLGSVVWLSTEDTLEYTMKPRLDAAGADCSRVFFVRGVLTVSPESGKQSSRGLRLDIDIDRLIAFLEQRPDVRMIVADPVTEILGPIDAHKNEQVRAVLGPLCLVLERFCLAGLGISHFSKATGTRALAKIIGSMAFVAVARVVWGIVPDGDDEDRRLFLPIKCNIAHRPPGMGFRITDAGVVWETEEVHTSVDDALQRLAEVKSGGKAGDKFTEATTWLKQRLAIGEEIESDTLVREAKAAGFSFGTFKRAREGTCKSRKGNKWENFKWFVSLQEEHLAPLDFHAPLALLEPLTQQEAQQAQETKEVQVVQEVQACVKDKTPVLHLDAACKSKSWWLASSGVRSCLCCNKPATPDLVILEGIER